MLEAEMMYMNGRFELIICTVHCVAFKLNNLSM